jgi:DNA-binding MarR family transcriptional regulator
MSSSLDQLDLTGTGACASFNFRRAARAVTRLFDDGFHHSGLRSTQFAILIAVAKAQPVSISQLSDLLIIDRTTLTRSLRLLQKQGFLAVARRLVKRQRYVTLAEKGVECLAAGLPEWRKTQKRFVAAIGAEYWGALRTELERMADVAKDL